VTYEMMKKVVSGCIVFMLLFCLENVTAASTCDYSEQVELNNAASAIQVNYEVHKTLMDPDGNVVSEEEAQKYLSESLIGDDTYAYFTNMQIHVLNMSENIYLSIKGDNGFEKTYYYVDTDQGTLSIDGGDLSKIINYEINIYSNSDRCRGDFLRKTTLVTPMINEYHNTTGCFYLPNYEYCQEYITSPFYATDIEIVSKIDDEYTKYLDSLQQEEEEKNKSFWEKLGDFFQEHKTIILSIVVVVIIGGALTTIVIVKNRRSRIL